MAPDVSTASTNVDMDAQSEAADLERVPYVSSEPLLGSPHTQRMSLSLDNIPNTIDPFKIHRNGSSWSIPTRSHVDHIVCPTCGGPITDTMIMNHINSTFNGFRGAPLGPLAMAAFDSDVTVQEELRLLEVQVSDVARVRNAITRGDLSPTITVPVQGVFMLQLKDVVNTMVGKLGQFAQEVAHISEEVNVEGKLGGQTLVPDVEGTWRELIDVVSKHAANSTNQVRSTSTVIRALDLSE